MKKLSLKMLLLTLGSFSLLISGIVVSLYIYFNHFYEPLKINEMIQDINAFSADYTANSWSDEELYQEVSKFMKNHNATMSIMSQIQIDGSSAAYNVTVGNYSSASVSASMPLMCTAGITTEVDLQATASPSMDSFFVSAAIPITEDIVIVGNKMEPDGTSILTEASETKPYDMGTSTLIDGSRIIFPLGSTTLSLSKAIEPYEKMGVKYVLSDMPYTNFKQVDFIKEMVRNDGEIKETFVNVSLQSVDEVIRTLNRFIPYLIVFAVLLSVVMTYVYSKTITRPIVAVTNVANRMANMELGIHSTMHRKDELGELSTSLNTLSTNLKIALDELVVKNKQLELDYENEIRQEVSRKEFVANVSHELKTPLGVIKSYAEGIEDGVKAEKRDYYVHVILDEIDKMDQMIGEMLEISKFDAGAVTYQKNMIHLESLMERVLGYFHEPIQMKAIQVVSVVAPTEVLIDEEKIARVLTNLIGNAIKYCPEKTVVTITSEEVGEGIKISVENACLPFSEQVLSKIWDRFYKGDTSHNREIEGSGLGLAIAKSILEGHGCSYGVENIMGGIKFYFVLPK